MEDVNTRQRFAFSFCELIDSPLECNFLKNRQQLTFKGIGIRAMKIETARIHFLVDVFAGVAVVVA